MHQTTLNWPWTLNNDKYSAVTKDLPLRLKFWSILLYNHWFSRHKVARKSEIHWVTPNWTWTLNSQEYSIYTWYSPLRPNFGPFRSMISHFRNTTCITSVKIGNATNDPKTELGHLTVKSTLYTLIAYLWGSGSMEQFPGNLITDNGACTMG